MESSEPQRGARPGAGDQGRSAAATAVGPDAHPGAGPPSGDQSPSTAATAVRGATTPRRARLKRGPLRIGEAAPAIEVRVARAEPYRPDTIADGGSAFGLTVRAASVRGLQKRYVGGPRQDDLCLRLHEQTGTLVAAVADGVSGATRSDLAAALAVRHATAAVVRQLDRGGEAIDWAQVFEHAAWALVEEHRRVNGDPRARLEDVSASLATTLLVATVADSRAQHPQPAGSTPAAGPQAPVPQPAGSTPAAGPQAPVPQPAGGTPAAGPQAPVPQPAGGTPAAGVQPPAVQLAAVGDSQAFLLSGLAFVPIVGDAGGDDGLLAGAVSAIPRAVHAVQTGACELEPGSVLLLCTDGLALPLAGGTGDVGRTFARELKRPPDVVDFARLLDFSRSTYDDDRTLIAIWCRR